MSQRERLWRLSGALTVVLTLGGVLTATVVSPAFRWQGNALSNLGVTSTAAGTPRTLLLFNGGLILGAVVGLVFSSFLVRVTGQRLVGSVFAVTVALLGLVGVFPQDRPLHFPVAVGFYLFVSVTLWLDAAVQFRRGRGKRALVSLTLGTANILTWVAWGALGPVTRPGLALPEIVGAVLFATWALLVVFQRFPGGPTADAGV